MVKGIEIFKSHFADWSDCYVLIGGSACDNDIARLSVLTAGVEPSVPEGIRTVMTEFMSLYQQEAIDTTALRLPIGEKDVKEEIRRLFL